MTVLVTQLEEEVASVWRRMDEGPGLHQALGELDESGHVADYIVERMEEVNPWIKRALAEGTERRADD